MSVQINQYIMLGVRFDWDEFYGQCVKQFQVVEDDVYDSVEKYRDSAYDGIVEHNGLSVIDDGMNCDYVIVGKVIEKTLEDDNIFGLHAIEFDEVEVARIKTAIVDQFGYPEERVLVKVYVFGHYS